MNKDDILNSALIRCAFLRFIQKEFGIHVEDDDLYKVEDLIDCIEVYDSWKDFFNETNWRKDNPESATKEYLMGQKICREVGGHIWYLSSLKWDETAD